MQSTMPLEVTYLRTTSLKPDPRNPRVHSDKQVRQIAQSIESFGFNVPLLIDDEQKVIAGHGRLLAARKLGWDTVPAIRLSHLTESQRMAFLIADNRLTENSSWDERMLGEQLKILSELELDFDLEAIGFEVPEIDLLIDGLNTVPEVDSDDRLPEISVRQGNGNTPIYQGRIAHHAPTTQIRLSGSVKSKPKTASAGG
jgi:ParB-like chromosome segregation protein Spo0J